MTNLKDHNLEQLSILKKQCEALSKFPVDDLIRIFEYLERFRLQNCNSDDVAAKKIKALEKQIEDFNVEKETLSIVVKRTRETLNKELEKRQKAERKVEQLTSHMSALREVIEGSESFVALPSDDQQKLLQLSFTKKRVVTSLCPSNCDDEEEEPEIESYDEDIDDVYNHTQEIVKDHASIEVEHAQEVQTTKRKSDQIDDDDDINSNKNKRSSKIVKNDEIHNLSDKKTSPEKNELPMSGNIRKSMSIPYLPNVAESIYPKINTPKTPGMSSISSVTSLSDAINYKGHVLCSKKIFVSENCVVCDKKIAFGKTCLKCHDCKLYCHNECKYQLGLKCKPVEANRKVIKNQLLEYYCEDDYPYIPSILTDCINEVEKRGLKEIGIYRIAGSEKDLRSLRESFYDGKEINMKKIDLHVVASFAKEFIRCLKEPLITIELYSMFASFKDSTSLMHCISLLPVVNSNTLAFIMRHLHRVSQSPDCKMDIKNLCRIFAPTLIGSSSSNLDMNQMVQESNIQQKIMEGLFSLPLTFWDTCFKPKSVGNTSPVAPVVSNTENLRTKAQPTILGPISMSPNSEEKFNNIIKLKKKKIFL